MATITTKYSIGDVVFFASTVTQTKQHPCPDCLGTKAWKAISPAGTEYEFSCPRCSARYNGKDELRLDYSQYVPSVQRLTIGSIRHDSAGKHWGEAGRTTEYMCRETGVGSGSIYDEDRLFLTEEDATFAAQAMADQQNVTVDWIVQRYNRTLDISDYQLSNVDMKLAAEAKSRASSMLWNLTDLFEKIAEADGKDEILEAVDDYKRFDWERDKKALAEAAE